MTTILTVSRIWRPSKALSPLGQRTLPQFRWRKGFELQATCDCDHEIPYLTVATMFDTSISNKHLQHVFDVVA